MKFRRATSAILVFALLLVLLPTTASALTSGSYTYSISSGKATITKYSGTSSTLTVPSKLGGYPVVSIASKAFYMNSHLKSVKIPSSVAKIGDYAFFSCSYLSSITIPTGVKSIGSYAFGATQLKSVSLPSSVTSIGGNAFCFCRALESITLPSKLAKISPDTFAYCNKLKRISIPKTVKSIGKAAFLSCSSLTSITIPSGVTAIPDETFENCKLLSSVSIPKTVKTIGYRAFASCTALKKITLPTGVVNIGPNAFDSCTVLSSVTLPSGLKTMGRSVFYKCKSLKSITIPYGVSKIDTSAFQLCSSLSSVSIPTSVKTIGARAFRSCTKLKTIKIPRSVSSITGDSFSLTGVKLRVYSGSYAYKYAKAKKISYVLIKKITVRPNNTSYGRVAGGKEYDKGKTATVTATPKSGYRFVRWTLNKVTASKLYKYSFMVTKDATYTAEFSKIGQVTILSATSVKGQRIQVKIKAVTGAKGYQIYRSTDGKNFSRIGTTSSTSFLNSGLTKGKTYYYKVRAYCSAGSTVTTGAYSTVKSVKVTK